MTSLRNAVKRKTHKERAQPAGRKKLGLLEKKKDYQLRARDFARKKKHLDSLRQKAELRNEDEFYFGMTHAQTEEGVHKEKRKGKESTVVKLAEHFDKNYLQTKLIHEQHQLNKLQSNLHFIGVDPAEVDPENVPRTTVFVDDEQEAEQFDRAEYFETVPELTAIPISLRANLDELKHGKIKIGRRESKLTEKAYAELLRRKKRVDSLSNAVQHVQLKHDLRGKGKRRKIAEAEGDRPAKYIWAQERKR